jgi:glutathione synthase/RimK-type ligase-like ATP-grasp enzyme
MDAPQPKQIDIAFITAREMPKPDQETHLIVDAVKGMEMRADVIPWDSSVDWAKIPLVVIRSAWDYFKRLPEFLAWARHVDVVSRLVNPYAVVEWNSHKSYLQQLSRKGVPTVPTILLERGAVENSARVLSGSGWSEVVIKPAVSIGAIGAFHTRTEEKASADHLESLLAEGDVLVQPFVSSVSIAGEVSMIYFDGEFSHAIRKLPTAGEYRVQDHYGGTVHPHVPTVEEHGVSTAALAATPKDTMYARVDLVSLDDRPVVMELELIEPVLFLSSSPDGTQRFAEILYSAVGNRANEIA